MLDLRLVTLGHLNEDIILMVSILFCYKRLILIFSFLLSYLVALDKPNQDTLIVSPKFQVGEQSVDQALFAVFDGHGKDGHRCASFVRENVIIVFPSFHIYYYLCSYPILYSFLAFYCRAYRRTPRQ